MFKLESEMGPHVCEWMQNAGLTVKSEFSVPWGICDFVGVSFNLRNVRKRLRLKQGKPIGPIRRIELLWQIPDQETGMGISEEELERVYEGEVVSHSLATDVEKLVADHFVSRSTSGFLQKLNGWMPLQKRLVAIELKLARVSEAIYQAAANKAFASESYVALPWQIALRQANGTQVSKFVEAGIGILAVSDSGCRVVLKPTSFGVQIDTNLQLHCVERFWRSRGSSA